MVEASSLRAPRDSPVALAELRALSPSVRASIMGMSPYAAEGEEEVGEAAVLAALQLKFTNNAMDLCDEEHTSALFNTIGRVNHDCVGNCEHFYVAEHGVMLLVAHKRIATGEDLL